MDEKNNCSIEQDGKGYSRFSHGVHDLRIRVTQNSGSPASHKVNVFVAIDIPCVSALDSVENHGVSTNGFEGPNWTGYTSGHQL